MIAILLLVALAVAVLVLLRRGETARRTAPGKAGTLVYRTDHPIDVCMDYLEHTNIHDTFAYTAKRDPDGSWMLHLTMHRPTQQPLDTLYVLRMDPGRQTVLTLIFLREAFGYKEPVFGPELMDAFMAQKFDAVRR